MTKFYVYLLIDPSNNIPFYVGKGKGKRYNVHFNPSAKGQNILKDKHIINILSRGEVVSVQHIPCDSEIAAYELETQLIQQYGRIDLGTGCLTNLQNGGEGAGSCRILSANTRSKISASNKGKQHSTETRSKISASIVSNGTSTAVIQLTLSGVEVARYQSARAASKATGVDGSHILYCCKGIYPSAKGYVWKYQCDGQSTSRRSKLIKHKVQKCDREWNVIDTYDSVSDAARSIGTSISYIGRVSNNQDFAFGFYWRKV